MNTAIKKAPRRRAPQAKKKKTTRKAPRKAARPKGPLIPKDIKLPDPRKARLENGTYDPKYKAAILRVMKKKKVSANTMEKWIGTSQPTISRWERQAKAEAEGRDPSEAKRKQRNLLGAGDNVVVMIMPQAELARVDFGKLVQVISVNSV